MKKYFIIIICILTFYNFKLFSQHNKIEFTYTELINGIKDLTKFIETLENKGYIFIYNSIQENKNGYYRYMFAQSNSYKNNKSEYWVQVNNDIDFNSITLIFFNSYLYDYLSNKIKEYCIKESYEYSKLLNAFLNTYNHKSGAKFMFHQKAWSDHIEYDVSIVIYKNIDE